MTAILIVNFRFSISICAFWNRQSIHFIHYWSDELPLIFSRNLDEFFEIRVAGMMEQLTLGNESRSPDGLTPKQVLDQISKTAHAAIERQYRILNEEILPKLREEDICFLRCGELTPAQSAWIKKYFQEQVAPVLTTNQP